MRTIRRCTFETNSSSTHSMTMCSDEEFNKLVSGELYIETWSGEIRSKEDYEKEQAELRERFEEYNPKPTGNIQDWEEELEDYLRCESEITTFEDYVEDEYLEYYQKPYTTPNGEKIWAFGKYGYNG